MKYLKMFKLLHLAYFQFNAWDLGVMTSAVFTVMWEYLIIKKTDLLTEKKHCFLPNGKTLIYWLALLVLLVQRWFTIYFK